MKIIELNNCKISTAIRPSNSGRGCPPSSDIETSISLTGKAEVPVNSLIVYLNNSLREHFLRDTESDADYHYVTVEFLEDKEENEYILVGVIELPHGSNVKQKVKVLNKTEKELYESFDRMKDFLLNEN